MEYPNPFKIQPGTSQAYTLYIPVVITPHYYSNIYSPFFTLCLQKLKVSLVISNPGKQSCEFMSK